MYTSNTVLYCMYVCMYVCKTLFTDASLVNKIVGFHKGRQTIKKKSQGRDLQKDRKGKKEEKINSMHIYKKLV